MNDDVRWLLGFVSWCGAVACGVGTLALSWPRADGLANLLGLTGGAVLLFCCFLLLASRPHVIGIRR